ncbi:hypothetical protein C7271_02015 [filamentous cyanobacterium CCP5]|nr:hypothetical protein C7271_02015 [filamentous cyanobacterium CCP5]
MKHPFRTFGVSTLLLGALGLVSALPAAAVRLHDGRVLFNRPPELVRVTTRDYFAGLPGQYHFTIQVPADAGEALEAISITPRNFASDLAFNLDRSEANHGEAYARGGNIPLASVGGQPDHPDALLVVFENPVQPGETVTVTLNASPNPAAGVYLFQVTAYPAGDGGVGQSIGLGRLHIYDAGN